MAERRAARPQTAAPALQSLPWRMSPGLPGHGKTLGCPMSAFFTRERFGAPQFLAGALLLVFLAQCAWLVHLYLQSAPGPGLHERVRIDEGLRQWHGRGIAGSPYDATSSVTLSRVAEYDADRSPVTYLLASGLLLLRPGPLEDDSYSDWGWLPRVPFLLFGTLLGASLWYVARRLYGNAGGFIALLLFCFSPAIIRISAGVLTEPEITAAWGAFGAIFTAIAVAHTLYAPREVVLWNWRRIMLLGLSLALAVGSQFSLWVVIPISLAFMLYLAPERRAAAVVIWFTGCVIALILLWAAYSFQSAAMWDGLRRAHFLGLTFRTFTAPAGYHTSLQQILGGSPALIIVLPVALIAYAAWPRARYFGNTAPLLVAALFVLLGIATPHFPGMGFRLVALPFLLVFAAGVFADLLETRHRVLVQASLCGLFIAYALWSVLALARISG